MNEIAYLSVIILLSAVSIVLIIRKSKSRFQTETQTQTLFSKRQKGQPSPLGLEGDFGERTDPRVMKFLASISLEKILIISTVSATLTIMIAILFPNISKAFILLGSVIFIPIGAIFGALFSQANKIKIMRKITGRNFGYVKFITSGKIIKTAIANLDNDIIKFGNGIYMINRKMIKKQCEKEVPSVLPIDETKIKYEDGIPTIYFDVDDIIPIEFSNIERDREEKFRLPSQVSATLNKEIAVEKAKIMNAFRKQQNILMIIIVASLILLLYFTYTDYTKIKVMSKTLSSINDNINSIKTIISGGKL